MITILYNHLLLLLYLLFHLWGIPSGPERLLGVALESNETTIYETFPCGLHIWPNSPGGRVQKIGRLARAIETWSQAATPRNLILTIID